MNPMPSYSRWLTILGLSYTIPAIPTCGLLSGLSHYQLQSVVRMYCNSFFGTWLATSRVQAPRFAPAAGAFRKGDDWSHVSHVPPSRRLHLKRDHCHSPAMMQCRSSPQTPHGYATLAVPFGHSGAQKLLDMVEVYFWKSPKNNRK